MIVNKFGFFISCSLTVLGRICSTWIALSFFQFLLKNYLFNSFIRFNESQNLLKTSLLARAKRGIRYKENVSHYLLGSLAFLEADKVNKVTHLQRATCLSLLVQSFMVLSRIISPIHFISFHSSVSFHVGISQLAWYYAICDYRILCVFDSSIIFNTVYVNL